MKQYVKVGLGILMIILFVAWILAEFGVMFIEYFDVLNVSLLLIIITISLSSMYDKKKKKQQH